MVRIRRGFTLIEILIVIAIIAILATLAMANYQNSNKRSRDARRSADVDTIKKALGLYYEEYEKYPLCTNACVQKLGYEITESNMPADFLVYLNPLPRNPLNYNKQTGHGYDYVVDSMVGSDLNRYGIWVLYEMAGTKGCNSSYPIGTTFCTCKTGADVQPDWWSTTPVCN